MATTKVLRPETLKDVLTQLEFLKDDLRAAVEGSIEDRARLHLYHALATATRLSVQLNEDCVLLP